jgi:general stress protein YciG
VKYGPGFYKSIGKKGGETTKQRHGPQFYEKIGRKGGQTMNKLIEQGKRAQRAR